MAVPDTNTFALTDVITELGLTLNSGVSLGDCFTASVDASFDAAYKGSKDRLSNFRNYGSTPTPTYGYLYNYFAYADANFAPVGWHLPSLAEWQTLLLELGGANSAGDALKFDSNVPPYWNSENTNATNSSGMSIIGAGWRSGISGLFERRLTHGYMGLSDEYNADFNYYNGIASGSSVVSTGFNTKRYGFSVRLIKDNSTDPFTVSDYDGNVYPTAKIGSQVWVAQNWKCTRLNNGTLIPTVTAATTWDGLTTGAKCAYDNDENYV